MNIKHCEAIENKLVAYLDGELSASDHEMVKEHVENCASCQAKLSLFKETIGLVADALQNEVVLSAPQQTAEEKTIDLQSEKIELALKRKRRFWDFPRTMATVLTSVAASLFLFVSLTAVVFTHISKKEQIFEAKEVRRPKMKLRKLKPPVRVQKKSRPKPKIRKTIVAKQAKREEMPDFAMPEVASVGAGFAAMSMAADYSGESAPGFGVSELDSIAMPEKNFSGSKSKADGFYAADNDEVMESAFAPLEEGVKKEAKSLMMKAKDKEAPSPSMEMEQEPSEVMEKAEFDDALIERRDHSSRAPSFNPYVLAVENAFSTFAIDVDTASYGLARRQLLSRSLPEPEQVRTEEFVNSFDYDYRPPAGKPLFAIDRAMAPSPFRSGMDVLKVGIKGQRIGRDNHRDAILTLVIDTSGSMDTTERIGLVKQSLRLLLDQLGPNDEVAIVQFGGEARLVCEHTKLVQKKKLLRAIDQLQPNGPTQFDKGLDLGYEVAMSAYQEGDSNRIIILSDGVANTGEIDPEVMLKMVEKNRRKGIYLSVLGFGAGSYDDYLLEQLANKGDGAYAYIDTMDEARNLFVEQLAATLHVIAADVKIQLEFNPERVLRYRQLGYENRQLTKEQFRDDSVDAGEVGSGQSVTALYDVALIPGSDKEQPIATVYVRYRRADNQVVEEISGRVMESVRWDRFEQSDPRFKVAVSVAEFAEKLRRSPYSEGTEMSDILNVLQPAAQELDLDKKVQELIQLIRTADNLIR